ncbi:MAG: FKBP-type peptidyl-prolyl cis-trans isomerase [Candidatus Anammoxibacter sp.]
MKTTRFLISFMILISIASCISKKKHPSKPIKVAESDYETTASGLKHYDIKIGEGAIPQAGQKVLVHYTGWFLDGKKFDSSLKKGKPFRFTLGRSQVIRGWDEGVSTMRVGGERQLVVPPSLGYGDMGMPGIIPANATLLFEIELLSVE